MTIVAAVVLSAVSAAVGMQIHAWLYRLPDPATADREGLVRWLVIADLSEHDDATCRTLVDRCEAVFADEGELPGRTAELGDEDRQRVQRNIERLKEVWFHARVDEYLELPDDKRSAFLDRQIGNIFRCAELDRRLDEGRAESGADNSGKGNAAAANTDSYVAAFFASLSQWQAAAPSAKRAQIDEVIRAGLIRWLATHDLAKQSASVRRSIVEGLEQELGDRLSFGDATSTLAASESTRFWRNVEVLAEAWFHLKAEQFAHLGEDERPAFVQRQLAVIDELAAHWPSVANNGTSDIAARLREWIAAAENDNRPAVERFAVALQKAWFARAFGSLLRGV